jgi:hypothetical protein
MLDDGSCSTDIATTSSVFSRKVDERMSVVAFDAKQLNEDKEHEGSCKSDQGRESATGKGDQGDEEAGRAHDMPA